MSWRVILVLLLALAGASAWGGLRLGEWLVAHGPEASAPPEADASAMPMLDADGKPFVAQPPQPQVDGRLTIPAGTDPIPWEIPGDALETIMANTSIGLANTTISLDEARQIAASDRGTPLQGIADVSGLGLGALGTNAPQPLQPIEMPPMPGAPSQAPAAPQAGGSWQNQLSQELQACAKMGFFSRPSCAWAARNKYCEPNNAWGRWGDCPTRQ